jgi:imidazolonepropionase-like amidohydrolase
MRMHVVTDRLFDGTTLHAGRRLRLTVEDDRISYVGDHAGGPPITSGEPVVDAQGRCLLPGLIDVHVHLSYGNAEANEDIDIYTPFEYRALRAMVYAQRVLMAGYTSLVDPATTGRVSPAVRDAINAGWYVGPRITAAGRQLTSRQGLGDWYPPWIGVPETSIGALVRSPEEAREEIRLQVKDGVDIIKIDLDGTQAHPRTGHLLAGFDQAEATAMVAEAQRLGRRVFVHAVDREAVLYAARAGADVIFHAFDMDDECLEAIVRNGCLLSPALTFLYNSIEFTQPSDPSYGWRPARKRKVVERALEVLGAARKAGVPFLVGTDSGFAVTPYGEWHARELQIMVDDLGFAPQEALTATTVNNARVLREHDRVGRLAAGMLADFVVVNGDPLADVGVLLKPGAIEAVYLGGRRITLEPPADPRRYPWERGHRQWGEVYDRDRVATLRATDGRGRR